MDQKQIEDLAKINPELRPYGGAHELTPYLLERETKKSRKVLGSIKQAIEKCGLKDGMTVSFHHSFRSGDKVVNMVMDIIASMGFQNLTLAASSLSTIHSPLVRHIENGVVTKIYTSGLRGELAEKISRGLMEKPVHIHSHGGRVQLIQSGEIDIDVAFIGVPTADEYGNANGVSGNSRCGALGYAQVDAENAKRVIMLTEQFVPFPNSPASISQEHVDCIVSVDQVGDASKIGGDATRMTTNPRELLIARKAADVIENSGYFKQDFSMQTGSGGASLAVTRFLEDKMRRMDISCGFALGGITAAMVELHEKGLIKKMFDTQSFDGIAAESLAKNENHIEVSTNCYANAACKGAAVEQLDIVILSALEIDTNFNVNVITGSDGVIRGASGGHSDTAASASMTVIVAPLVRGRIPTVVKSVLNTITDGSQVDVLVTDHGVCVNPERPDIAGNLRASGMELFTIEELQQRAELLTGVPRAIEYQEKIVGIVRYRDGSVLDVIRQIKE